VTDSYGDEVGTEAPGHQPSSADPGFEPTGNPVVDSVLESLERLDDAPVSEHVTVFESAHERLRGALADAGKEQEPEQDVDNSGQSTP
jgi:hypothetical protein